MVQHLVVHDALQEEQRHVGVVEHGMDADQTEHGVVAAEGEAAAPRPSAPASPGEGHAELVAEELHVQRS
jgi:hypothetical protein